jgi:hypothetical protein
MSSFFGAVMLVIGVVALTKVFRLFPIALQAVHTSRSALVVMTDPDCGDERKESLLQGYSVSLLRSCVDLLIRGIGSIALPVGLLWTLECAGLLSLEAVLDLTRSWSFLLGGAIATTATLWLLEK